MRRLSLPRTAACAALAAATIVAAVEAGAAETADIAALFGARVKAVAGAKSPLARGDFDGDGQTDDVYFVRVGLAIEGKSIASDVHVVTDIFGGEALAAGAATPGVAIVLKNGAAKYLIVDYNKEAGSGVFDTPMWSSPADWSKNGAPLRAAKRGSKDLKGFPCLGKATKGDVLMAATESGIEIALPWTGASFRKCENPNDEP